MSKNTKTALVVDDETPDLEVLAEALAAAGYRVITVSDGKTAVESFHAHSEPIGRSCWSTETHTSPSFSSRGTSVGWFSSTTIRQCRISAFCGSLSRELDWLPKSGRHLKRSRPELRPEGQRPEADPLKLSLPASLAPSAPTPISAAAPPRQPRLREWQAGCPDHSRRVPAW